MTEAEPAQVVVSEEKPLEIEVVNQLTHPRDRFKKGHPKTERYGEFGVEQVKAVNDSFLTWRKKQTFSKVPTTSLFKKLVVSGSANEPANSQTNKRDCSDAVKWDLHFQEKVGAETMSNALLHEKRYPKIISDAGSKPHLFSTSDYIQISVSNDERGWVRLGEFPKTPHIISIDVEEDDFPPRTKKIAIYTDTLEDAVNGFGAALEHQKFRDMAVSCSDYLRSELSKENKRAIKLINSEKDGVEKLHMHDNHRDRLSVVLPLYVQLLPDTRLAKAPTEFYRPGALEARLAMGMEYFIKKNSNWSNEDRPINWARAKPIEVAKTKAGYDATVHLKLNMCLSKDPTVNSAIEEQLRTRYDARIVQERQYRYVTVSHTFKDAHTIDEKIRNGEDTDLDQFVRVFGQALISVRSAIGEWEDIKAPSIKAITGALTEKAKQNHFSALSEGFEPKPCKYFAVEVNIPEK
jgi:hypothetical protein